MPHVHIGLNTAIAIYLMWFAVHVLVQLIGIQLHNSRIGQVLATFG